MRRRACIRDPGKRATRDEIYTRIVRKYLLTMHTSFIARNTKYFILISALFLVPGIYSLIRFGLKPSIDFTGGATLTLQLSKPVGDLSSIRKVVESKVHVSSLVHSGAQDIVVRTAPMDVTTKDTVEASLKTIDPNIRELSYETIGPTLGKELLVKTGIGVVAAISLIIIYLAMRFPSPAFGVSAALAGVHDVLIILGTFSLLGHFYGVEVDVLFVTAILTVLSFSLHDTLIVYDRIRERMKKAASGQFGKIVDEAVLETINRSLRNSLAVILMLLVGVLLGGETLRWFLFALLVGTITGTYSSICVALPILVAWKRVTSKEK
ncbi:protein translocase subunit SecF [Candidatus Cerribacteria bacterium 'Amazon FNV 2010 28 9']|uniref:Protein-export membrane protein SecF n=1 Tax=Candidatus Cerribacteria bacterium 'Amazon FNV 2010 28 9' TaxID=2081795 RepID=A0A317JPE5_9BACT|nr:MAG: protein translocase subunit SecF [Candidatus Cerribacteria bacterium 'Amazon FNV 2010 28 9']